MRVRVDSSEGSYTYTVCDIGDKTSEELAGMLYTLNSEGVYERKYPRSLMFDHNRVLLEKNYNLYLQNKTHTLADVEHTLEWICKTHQDNTINWWLAGSAALYARGLDILPHDIDIMTYKRECEKIKKCVFSYISEPFHHVQYWVVKGFGVIYKDIRVDYAFEPESWVDGQGYVDFGPYAENHLERIDWKGYPILVPPLELHIKSNEMRGREEIVRKIIKAQKSSAST